MEAEDPHADHDRPHAEARAAWPRRAAWSSAMAPIGERRADDCGHWANATTSSSASIAGWPTRIERERREFVLDERGRDHRPIIGRLVARGLDDELKGTAYAVIDGADGRAHHVRLADLDAASELRRAHRRAAPL